MKRLLPNLALGTGTALALGLLFETGVRLFAPQLSPYAGLYRADAAVGVRHVPFFRGRPRLSERAVGVETNSLGFRDREYAAAKGQAFRILGLGDSFTFGVGVEEEETYLTRIESALRAEQVEVINAGLIGVGPDSQARLLEAIGSGLQPDLVLVGFFAGNDLLDVMVGTDGLEVRDGALAWRRGAPAHWERALRPGHLADLERAPEVPLPFKGFLRRYSHAYRFLSGRFAVLRARWGPGRVSVPQLTPFHEEAFCLRDYPPEFEQAWLRTRDALERIRAWSDRHGAAMMIVLIPFRGQVEPERWQEFRQTYGVREEDLDPEKPQALVKRWAGPAGVTVLDLLPALRRARQQAGELYYQRDPHWTARGHAVAAEEILAQLRSSGVLAHRHGQGAGGS